MTQKQLLDTALKILSLYFFIRMLGVFRDIVLYFGLNGFLNEIGFEVWITFGGMFFNLITNIALFKICIEESDKILTFLKIGDNTAVDETKFLALKKGDWLETGIIMVGIIVVSFALPEILYKMTYTLFFQIFPGTFSTNKESNTQVYLHVFEITVGMIMILFSAKLSRTIVNRGNGGSSFI